MHTQELRAGASIDDLCRSCKMTRMHTVVAVAEGRSTRVMCDYCRSEHNYRGGRRKVLSGTSGASSVKTTRTYQPDPIVSDREKSLSTDATFSQESDMDIELLLRKVIREEMGVTPVALGDKWRNGTVEIIPGRDGVQSKSIPIETFFSKIIAVRNRLRVLEQQINKDDSIPTELKVKLQGYITASYGSLTTFNVLFAEEGDKFKGAGRDNG